MILLVLSREKREQHKKSNRPHLRRSEVQANNPEPPTMGRGVGEGKSRKREVRGYINLHLEIEMKRPSGTIGL